MYLLHFHSSFTRPCFRLWLCVLIIYRHVFIYIEIHTQTPEETFTTRKYTDDSFVRSLIRRAFPCVAEFNSVCTPYHLKIGHRSIFSPCFLPCAVFIAVCGLSLQLFTHSLARSLAHSLTPQFCECFPFSPLTQIQSIRSCLLSPFRSHV